MERSNFQIIRSAKAANILCRNKRWMVSMSGHQGYITVATYDRRYVDFLYDEPQTGNLSFMLMEEYGPFDLRRCSPQEDDGLDAFLKAIAILMGF